MDYLNKLIQDPVNLKFDQYTLEQKQNYYSVLKNKYPDRIPVILKKGNKILQDIDKNKYLMPKNLTVSNLVYLIRNKIKIDDKQAIFLFVNNTLVPMNTTINELYNEHHSEDKFLYIVYSLENTFG